MKAGQVRLRLATFFPIGSRISTLRPPALLIIGCHCDREGASGWCCHIPNGHGVHTSSRLGLAPCLRQVLLLWSPPPLGRLELLFRPDPRIWRPPLSIHTASLQHTPRMIGYVDDFSSPQRRSHGQGCNGRAANIYARRAQKASSLPTCRCRRYTPDRASGDTIYRPLSYTVLGA